MFSVQLLPLHLPESDYQEVYLRDRSALVDDSVAGFLSGQQVSEFRPSSASLPSDIPPNQSVGAILVAQ